MVAVNVVEFWISSEETKSLSQLFYSVTLAVLRIFNRKFFFNIRDETLSSSTFLVDFHYHCLHCCFDGELILGSV